jgi:hypothetical protein
VVVAQVVLLLLVLEIQKIQVVLAAHELQMIVGAVVVVLLDILELVVLEELAQLLPLLEQVVVAVVVFMDLMELLLQMGALVVVFSFMGLVQMDLLELLVVTQI